MKKIMICLFAIFLITACDNSSRVVGSEELAADKVYFFYSNNCPHCHQALEYINKKYPHLKLSMVNVANPSGYRLFVQCARKFQLGNQIGTPLFCMGDQHLMGWSSQSEEQFDQNIKPFIH